MLQVVIGRQKNNFIGKLKLEPITIYYLLFVMKVYIMKNVVDVSFFLTIPLFLFVVGSSIIFYYFILTYKELTPQQL